MTTPETKPRVTSFAPQFLVDDLERSMELIEWTRFNEFKRTRVAR